MDNRDQREQNESRNDLGSPRTSAQCRGERGSDRDTTTEERNQLAEQKTKRQSTTSAAKVAANQHNCLKSPGPTSREGKKRSARNSLKHGFFSRWLAIADPVVNEDPRDLNCLREEIWTHYAPVGFEESLRCEEIVAALWKRQRLLRYESGQIARNLAEQRMFSRIKASSAEGDFDNDSDPEMDAMTDHLLLLSKEDLDRRLRYDGLIRRQLNFAIAQLARLQARRKGELDTRSQGQAEQG